MIGFLAWALRTVRPWRGLLALLLLFTLVQIAYLIGAPLLWKMIFDDGIAHQDSSALVTAIVYLAGLLALFAVANAGHEWVGGRLAVNGMNRLRRRLFDHLLALSPRFHAATRAGELADRFSADLGAIETALVRGFPQLVTHGLSALLSVVILFLIEWRLALATLACMPLIFLASRPFSSRASGANDELRREGAGVVQLVQESAAAHLVVRLFRMQAERRAALDRILHRLAPQALRAHFLSGVVGRSAHVASGFMELVIIGYGGYLTLTGAMTPGLLVAFVGLMFNIGGAIAQLNNAIPLMIQGNAGIKQVEALLATVPEVLENTGARPLGPLREGITLEGLSFSYDGATPALAGIDLTIRAGEKVAFVGPSGCGKSTLQSLLMRLYAPGAGRILFDGIDLRELTEDSLRQRMAVVPQGPVLFDATIRENLLLARADATEEELLAATRAAAVHDTILALPAGYDTPVGAGGGNLSGGQRQRIAIARALLREADILLLDEATSALDPASEEAVNGATACWAEGRTVISVSHRLQAIRDYDRICVFAAGRLVESGRHDQLLAANGLYAELWRKQHGFNYAEEGVVAGITVERLQAIPFFADCDRDTLEQLSGLFSAERFSAGGWVFRQGDPGDRFYVVVRGELAVMEEGEEGAQAVLRELGDGDTFGEIALLESRPRTATVRAKSETLCLTLSRDHFLRLMDDKPALRARMLESIGEIREGGL
ncbi:ABC transporter transmembrane domain-containing protein [Endothiovibrio diazotrophicus]